MVVNELNPKTLGTTPHKQYPSSPQEVLSLIKCYKKSVHVSTPKKTYVFYSLDQNATRQDN